MRINFGPLLFGLADLFETGAHPALAQAAPAVVGPLRQAAAAVDEAIPGVADDMANAALAKVPGGALATPFADEVINATIAKLEAKLSTAVTGVTMSGQIARQAT